VSNSPSERRATLRAPGQRLAHPVAAFERRWVEAFNSSIPMRRPATAVVNTALDLIEDLAAVVFVLPWRRFTTDEWEIEVVDGWEQRLVKVTGLRHAAGVARQIQAALDADPEATIDDALAAAGGAG
jgi:hypothetical protein